MNHKERALAAVKHELPDRVPAFVSAIEYPDRLVEHFGLKDVEELYEFLGYDFRTVFPQYTGADPHKNVYNHFGLPAKGTYSSKQVPLPFAKSETIKEIDSFPWPSVDEWDFESLHAELDKIHDKYAVIAGAWAPIFCQVLWFFGLEEAMINMHVNPGLIEAALAHIEEFFMVYYRRFFAAVSGKAVFFNMGDDFATQRGMMIDPAHWRRFFKPVYRKIFELAKSHGLYVWFHACGAITDVLPDLIDIGLDVWETVQAHLPGNEPERIKRDFGKNLTFYGAINTQDTLPNGTPDDVRKEVRERIKILGAGGGYICGPDHQLKVEVPFENITALFDEINRFRHAGCTL